MDLNKRAQEMNEFFNKVVDIDYDERHMEKIKGKERVIDYLPSDVENILDLGSGTGLQLIKLYKLYPNVHTTCIDVSDGMLKKLKERNLSSNINIINTSFFNYDFGNNNYDSVISTQALHHFNKGDKLTLYKKVYDALKNNGVFIIEDYYVNNDEEEKNKYDEYVNEVYGPEHHYDTPLTVEHELEILKSVGFDTETELTDDYRIVIGRKK